MGMHCESIYESQILGDKKPKNKVPLLHLLWILDFDFYWPHLLPSCSRKSEFSTRIEKLLAVSGHFISEETIFLVFDYTSWWMSIQFRHFGIFPALLVFLGFIHILYNSPKEFSLFGFFMHLWSWQKWELFLGYKNSSHMALCHMDHKKGKNMRQAISYLKSKSYFHLTPTLGV